MRIAVCGYTVNALRRPDQPIDDSRYFVWDLLRLPAAYPWFSDPVVNDSVLPIEATRDYFGIDTVQNWGVGYHHPQSTGRTAFADGHVEGIAPEVLTGPVDTMGTPLWLLDAP